MGDTTAAVPVANASLILPLRQPSATSSIEMRRSVTSISQLRATCITESRVTPERIEPDRLGVTSSSSMTKNMLLVPTSSTYLRSTASSHRTCV